MASVGEPGRRVSPTLSAPTTPLLATSAVPQQQLFPIARWRPRSGLTMQHHHFKRGVVQLFAAFGLAPEAMQEKAPTIRINPHSSDSAAGKPGGDVPMSTEQMEGAWCQIFARVAEQTRRLNTKTYHCEWCATSITPSDDSFWCQNDDCHKVVCGRKGCSSNLAYFACCEECEDE